MKLTNSTLKLKLFVISFFGFLLLHFSLSQVTQTIEPVKLLSRNQEKHPSLNFVNYNFASLYNNYLKNNSLTVYLDGLIELANSMKLGDYLMKNKIKKLNLEGELGKKIIYLSDLLKTMKELPTKNFNMDILVNREHQNKPEIVFAGFISKINFENKSYNPIEVTYDTEQIPSGKGTNLGDWKVYVSLMALDGFENRLAKICLSEKNIGIIVKLKVDEECKPVINLLEKHKLISDSHLSTSVAKKINEIEKKIVESNTNQLKDKQDIKARVKLAATSKEVENKIIKKEEKLLESNLIDENNNIKKLKITSFLEKSSASATATATSESKLYSVSQLANKFSVEELNKIKAIIKFAKRNKITEKIYSVKGDISLEELASGSQEIMLNRKREERLISIEKTLGEIQKDVSEIKRKFSEFNTSKDNNNSSNTESTSINSSVKNTSYNNSNSDNNNNTNIRKNDDISRLIATASASDEIDDDSFLENTSHAKTNAKYISTENNNKSSITNYNTQNQYTPKKSNLKPYQSPTSHKNAQKHLTPIHAPAPAASTFKPIAPKQIPKEQQEQLQQEQIEQPIAKIDEFDDSDAFAP